MEGGLRAKFAPGAGTPVNVLDGAEFDLGLEIVSKRLRIEKLWPSS